MTMALFDAPSEARQVLAEGAVWLRGFALAHEHALGQALDGLLAQAPLRHMVTPSGARLSVSMSNCGALGWVSDPRGYRYTAADPLSGRPWPAMPPVLAELAQQAAHEAGLGPFTPDACLINRYVPGARLSLHRDEDERDLSHPIVSVSLGLPATFLFGGLHRSDKVHRLSLAHGDVLVWGGPARMRYHGVLPLAGGPHPRLGACRMNLTFRRAG